MKNGRQCSQRCRTGVACLASVALLALVWLVSVIAEPHLIALVVPLPPVGQPRSSAGGWANSNIWLIAEAGALAALLLVGFVAKWLSSRRSWAAPMFAATICIAYVVFAQLPATRSPWRIALWSLGPVLSVVAGAAVARWAIRRERVASRGTPPT